MQYKVISILLPETKKVISIPSTKAGDIDTTRHDIGNFVGTLNKCPFILLYYILYKKKWSGSTANHLNFILFLICALFSFTGFVLFSFNN